MKMRPYLLDLLNLSLKVALVNQCQFVGLALLPIAVEMDEESLLLMCGIAPSHHDTFAIVFMLNSISEINVRLFNFISVHSFPFLPQFTTRRRWGWAVVGTKL